MTNLTPRPDDAATTTPAVLDGLDYSAELVARAEAEARHAVPRWFWAAGTAVVLASAAISAYLPWGWAA